MPSYLANCDYPNQSQVLMSDDATRKILNELTNISVETYDEIGEADGSQSFNPYEMLEKMLIISRERVKKG